MEKSICRLSYWLGITSLVISLLWKVMNVFVAIKATTGPAEGPLTFNSFVKAAILFLVTTIATKAYMSVVAK